MREMTALLEALSDLLDPPRHNSRAEALLNLHNAASELASRTVDSNDGALLEAFRILLEAARTALADTELARCAEVEY